MRHIHSDIARKPGIGSTHWVIYREPKWKPMRKKLTKKGREREKRKKSIILCPF